MFKSCHRPLNPLVVSYSLIELVHRSRAVLVQYVVHFSIAGNTELRPLIARTPAAPPRDSSRAPDG